jgi:hypothetical protein
MDGLSPLVWTGQISIQLLISGINKKSLLVNETLFVFTMGSWLINWKKE